MEPTIIQNPSARSPDDSSNLPVPAPDAALDAHQRAPTLMAADEAAHRNVRVWAPDKGKLRARRALFKTLGVVMGVDGILSILLAAVNGASAPWWGVVALLGAGLVAFCASFVYLLRPHKLIMEGWIRRMCVSTDDNGISLVTATGTRSLHWDEIVGCKRILSTIFITRAGGERILVAMGCFSPPDIRAVEDLVRSRASLQPGPRSRIVAALGGSGWERADGRTRGLVPALPPGPRQRYVDDLLLLVLTRGLVRAPRPWRPTVWMTSDEEGLTMAWNRRRILWSEVIRLSYRPSRFLAPGIAWIYTTDRVPLAWGLSADEGRSLVELICNRANLRPHPFQAHFWVRADSLPALVLEAGANHRG